jgi:hypothetical protein
MTGQRITEPIVPDVPEVPNSALAGIFAPATMGVRQCPGRDPAYKAPVDRCPAGPLKRTVIRPQI